MLITLHYSYLEWPKYKAAKLHTVYRNENRKQERNDQGRVEFSGDSETNSQGVGAEVTSGGRLFQRRLSATGNARLPTVDSRVYVGSLAVRMTTTGDGGGWNRSQNRHL